MLKPLMGKCDQNLILAFQPHATLTKFWPGVFHGIHEGSTCTNLPIGQLTEASNGDQHRRELSIPSFLLFSHEQTERLGCILCTGV